MFVGVPLVCLVSLGTEEVVEFPGTDNTGSFKTKCGC